MKNRRQMILNSFLLFFVAFVMCWGFSVQAEASPEDGVQVSPIRFDWKMKEGEQKVDEIVVHNFSDIAHNVVVEVEDFFVSKDSQQANFFVPDDNHPLKAYDVIDWIDAPEDFVLKPGETKKFQFIINVPEGQPTSGYYGSIFFKTNADDAQVKNTQGGSVNLGVNYRVGVLITLAVQGDEPMMIDGSVEEFDVIKKVFWESPITLFARLKSDGNIHYKAGGEMKIEKFGNKFAIIKIEDEVMYPGKTRIFTEQAIFGPWDYGVYSAKLNMQSEDDSVQFIDEIPFFLVIPWKTTAIVSIGLFLIVIIIKTFRRKFAIVQKKKLDTKKSR